MLGRRLRAFVLVAAPCVVASLLHGRTARADTTGRQATSGLEYVLVPFVVLVAAADVGYLVYDVTNKDTNRFNNSGPSPDLVAATELIVTMPQLVPLSIIAGTSDAPDDLLFLGAAVLPGALFTHSVVTLSTNANQAFRTSLAPFSGVDLAFATYDVARINAGKLPSAPYAWLETGVMAAQTAYGLVEAGKTTGADMRANIALTALPAALTVHGIWTLARRAKGDVGSPRSSQDAARVRLAPSMLSDGVQRTPGVVCAGTF